MIREILCFKIKGEKYLSKSHWTRRPETVENWGPLMLLLLSGPVDCPGCALLDWISLLWPRTHITYFRTAPNVGFCPRSLMSIVLHTEGDQILPPNLGDSVVNAQL